MVDNSGIDIQETNTNNGMEILRMTMNHAIPQRNIQKAIMDNDDFGTMKIVGKVTAPKKT